jgi:SAM-dependent methyltransferase
LLRKIDIELFKIYSIKDQFSIANEYKEKFNNSDDLTYGEAIWYSIDKSLKYINVDKCKNFLELGCGIGRISFFVNFYYKLNCCGVDIIPDFIENANKIIEKFNLKNIEFINKNWFDVDFSFADIIFIAGTCLDIKTLKLLKEKFEKELKENSYILSVSVNFKSDKIEEIKVLRLPFSWGKADLYILKKI